MNAPKNFLLNFTDKNPEINFEQEWSWQPENKEDANNIKTATFSGKNQADDYQTE